MLHHGCRSLLALLLGIVLLGCEPPTQTAGNPAGPPVPPPPPGATPPPPADSTEAASTVATEAPPPPETKFGVFAGDVNDLAARPAAPTPPPAETPAEPPTDEPATERVKAEKGVGIKGRSLDQYEGLIVTPAKAYFSARERIVFDAQIPHALNLYKASEGKGPASHEEFMEKIVQFNQIKLPQLPPGHKYVYDVEQELLMVERPKQQ